MKTLNFALPIILTNLNIFLQRYLLKPKLYNRSKYSSKIFLKNKKQGYFPEKCCFKCFIQIQKCTSLIEINDIKENANFSFAGNLLRKKTVAFSFGKRFRNINIVKSNSIPVSLKSFNFSYENYFLTQYFSKIRFLSPFNIHFNKLIKSTNHLTKQAWDN